MPIVVNLDWYINNAIQYQQRVKLSDKLIRNFTSLNNRKTPIAKPISPNAMKGIRLPYLELVLSDIPPIIGSVKASTNKDKAKPKPHKKGSKPRTWL